jgi:hypothetical protein
LISIISGLEHANTPGAGIAQLDGHLCETLEEVRGAFRQKLGKLVHCF